MHVPPPPPPSPHTLMTLGNCRNVVFGHSFRKALATEDRTAVIVMRLNGVELYVLLIIL